MNRYMLDKLRNMRADFSSSSSLGDSTNSTLAPRSSSKENPEKDELASYLLNFDSRSAQAIETFIPIKSTVKWPHYKKS